VVAIVIVIVVTGGGGSPAVEATVAATTPTAAAPTTTTPTPTTGQTTKPTAPALRVTLAPAGNLSKGDSGAPVVTLQKALTALGHEAGTPDGNFGPTTEAAVIEFQKANGLTPDGIVGAKTAHALNQALRNS
jgi:peptidoglycan hydrolase-like protein with peptidoglycan-binding domain